MKKGGESRKAMEDLDESWLMEDDWDESWLMEEDEDDETLRTAPSQMVMCSICSGFVMLRKKRTSKEVLEVVMEAKKMRALTNAVLLHGPLQETEPAQATKKQRRFLGQMRTIMMETMRCPACSRSVLGVFPTCSACCCCLSKKPGSDEEEDKAAGSKEKKKKNSREESSELITVGKERKKNAMEEDEAMVADDRSVKKSKQSRKDCNGSSSGLKTTKKKKARSSSGLKKVKSEDEEGNGSRKKAKGWSEMEGCGREEAEMEGNRSKDVKMKVRESARRNGKTKMVTRRMDKMSIDFLLEECPPSKPHTYHTLDPFLESMFASNIAKYNVDLEFRDYLRRQASIRGYAEYQLEVTDDEEEMTTS